MSFVPIVESFISIQGEGRYIGLPATFVRVGGCNLKCGKCDTPFAQEVLDDECVKQQTHLMAHGENLTIKRSRIRRLVFTGGEPLLWLDRIVEMIEEMRKEKGPRIHTTVETNGTLSPLYEAYEYIDFWSVSPKLECMDVQYPWPRFARTVESLSKHLGSRGRMQFKLVVSSLDDLRKKGFRQFVKISQPMGRVRLILQPEGSLWDKNNPGPYLDLLRDLTERVCASPKLLARFDVQVLPQLHLMLWSGERRR